MKYFLSLILLTILSCKSTSSFSKEGFITIGTQEKVQTKEHTFLKIEKILSDSRCPEGVNCIRAGEVKLLLQINTQEDVVIIPMTIDYKNFETNKKLLEQYIQLDQEAITGIQIYPNAKDGEKISSDSYYLKVLVAKSN